MNNLKSQKDLKSKIREVKRDIKYLKELERKLLINDVWKIIHTKQYL